jgi:hypothetical protein
MNGAVTQVGRLNVVAGNFLHRGTANPARDADGRPDGAWLRQRAALRIPRDHNAAAAEPRTTKAHFYVWLRGLRVGRRDSCNWLAAKLTLPGSNATMTVYAPR